MKKLFQQITILFVLAALTTTAVFALGSDEDKKQSSDSWIEVLDNELVDIYPSRVSGDIDIAGSSTVFPVAERLVEIFVQDGYSGSINVASIGSGAGFERWAEQAETDISNASRPIKDKEIQAAIDNGRSPLEFKIGTDALAVVVHPQNDWISDASIDELAAIFSSKKWSDINANWPNENILKFSPGTDSGTFDFFVEEVFDKNQEPLLGASNLQLSEDDNILSRGIQNNKYAIGYFGYAYYYEERENLKALSIEGITANRESVDASTYPLARPLLMYSAASIFIQKPQVAAFIGYVLLNVNDIIDAVGYFPATEADIAQSTQEFIKAVAELQ